MPRFASCVTCLFVLCGLASGIGRAQEITYLKVQPDRLQKAQKVEQEAISKNDSLLLAEAWYLYGKTYVLAGDYRTAQAYFLKSLRIHEPRGSSYELSRLYVRLSENDVRQAHFTEALHYAKLALQIAQHIRSEKGLHVAYGALGRVYESIWDGRLEGNQTNYDSALTCYRKSEYIARKLNDTLAIAEASIQLGTFVARVNDPQAVPYLKKALHLFVLKNKNGGAVNAMLHLASAYMNSRQFDLAHQTLVNAEKFYTSKKLSEHDTRLVLEDRFVHYYETTGQWKNAYKRLRKLNELLGARLLADRDGAVSRLNIEYETQKKEVQLKAQKLEIALDVQNLQTQQRFTIATSGLLILAVGMSLVFFRLYRKNQRISRQNEELVKEQNHRVKNNLQVVSSLLNLQSKRLTDEAAKKAVEESRLRVESMAIIHRKLYDGDKLAQVNVDEFIQELVGSILKSYGYSTIQPEFQIDTINLSADKAVPLGLIVNELTTNACKYAFPVTETPRYLISCRRNKQIIELKVADNGPGLDGPGLDSSGWINTRLDRSDSDPLSVPALAATKKMSFGVQLIQAQVEQLNGTYQFRTDEKSAATGVVFTMEFSA